MSYTRVGLLLTGVAPSVSPTIAAAYLDGVNAANSNAAGAPPVQAPVTAAELGSFLAGDDPRLRTLSVHALLRLAREAAAPQEGDSARAALTEALSARTGAYKGLFAMFSEAAAACEARAKDGLRPVVDEQTAALAELLVLLLPPVRAHMPPDHGLAEGDALPLCAAAAAFLRLAAAATAAAACAGGGPELAATPVLVVAIRAMDAWLYCMSAIGKRDAIAAQVEAHWAAPELRDAMLSVLARVPRTAAAFRLISVISLGTHAAGYCTAFLLSDGGAGLRGVLSAVSATVHDDRCLASLLCVVSNSCGMAELGPALARAFAEHSVFDLLQPPLLSSNAYIAIQAAYSVATLARHEELCAFVEGAELTPVLLDVLRALSFGCAPRFGRYDASDVQNLTALIGDAKKPALQLAGLHHLSAVLAGEQEQRASTVRFVLAAPAVVAALRKAAASPDQFVYMGACHVLRTCDEPVPVFRLRGGGGGDDGGEAARRADPAAWNVEGVVAWVAKQPFKAYAPSFRQNLVTGRVLLTLTDEDLASAVGVANALHRRTILFAIADLCGGSGGVDRGGGSSGGALALSPQPFRSPQGSAAASPRTPSREEESFDVFISYRRAGGADFAQLLKILLRAEGLRCFLDVENLGLGNFEEQLVKSLRASKNVVLVWTKGCMDRFLDGKCSSGTDFVLQEYKHALSMGINIVPFYKEDFEFPAAERLPLDVRPVMSMNAVKFIGEYREASIQRLIKSLQV